MSWCSRFWLGAASSRFSIRAREVLSQPLQAQCSPDPGIMPQGPGEGTCALGACETFGSGVKVRPAAWCGAVRVGHDGPGSCSVLRVRPCDHSQQLTLGGTLPATDTGADGTVRACRAVQL